MSWARWNRVMPICSSSMAGGVRAEHRPAGTGAGTPEATSEAAAPVVSAPGVGAIHDDANTRGLDDSADRLTIGARLAGPRPPLSGLGGDGRLAYGTRGF